MQEELRLPLTGNMSGFGVPLAHQSASFIRGVKNNAYFFFKSAATNLLVQVSIMSKLSPVMFILKDMMIHMH